MFLKSDMKLSYIVSAKKLLIATVYERARWSWALVLIVHGVVSAPSARN
jgi:hypothetical protein